MAAESDTVVRAAEGAGSSDLSVPAVPASRLQFARSPVLRLFISVFLSLYGDWLTTVALIVLLFQVTGSAAGPAVYLLVRVAPRVVGPWIGGSLADRFSPRRVMVVAACAQGVLTASLVLSHERGVIWAIYAAVAAAQFFGALARPSNGAMLPSLISADRLSRANALYGLFFSTSIFVGPAIGAALLLRTGPDLLFAIDAATFLVAAILAATLPSGSRAVRVPAGSDDRPVPPASTFAQAARDPVVRLVAAVNVAMGMSITVAQALLVVAAHERFGNDAAVGILYAAVGVGGTIGGLLALRWSPPRSRMLLALFLAIAIELIALGSYGAVAAVVPGLILLAFSTVASASLDVWGMTEVQRRAPWGYAGRFNAIPWASQYAGMLIGAIWALTTTTIFHWDVALEIACLGSALLVAAAGLTGGRDAIPENTREP